MLDKASQIQPGDTVVFRSNGYKLTVIDVEGDGANCEWQLGSERHSAWFSFACLAKPGRFLNWRKFVPVLEKTGHVGSKAADGASQ